MPDEVKPNEPVAAVIPEPTPVEQPAADAGLPATTSINGRPCQLLNLELTGYKVYIAEYLTAGEDEDATSTLIGKDSTMKDAIAYRNTVEQKYLLMQSGVRKILDRDGREVSFSKDWYRALPSPDAKLIQRYVREHFIGSGEKKNTDWLGTWPNC